MAESPVHAGACLCGGTRLEIAGPADTVVLCHCTQCRRGTGAAFNVAVVVRTDQVTFHARDLIREFESSPGKVRAFCSACGASVYSRRFDTPDALRLRGGLFIDLPRPADLKHIHYDSRWPWIDDIWAAPKQAG